MIVCVCYNVSDRKIRQEVDAGLTSMSELRNKLGVGTCCGKCNACAKQVLRECLEEASGNELLQLRGAVAA
ncbi:(2Fe-2S)-binding protein [Noviherbaspirillum massiliense]|uniref:(2Fe-2S)-binding protein n=1 Tax=Noviherbaspirillum massiliense TaxID=1465823 RepID=UPI0002F3C576|nr:(2Fe-2S)-binding protein [Noviherbaspirillum massiliense]